MSQQSPFSRQCIARCARIYVRNCDAALALGITPSSFGRLCRRYRIETAPARRRRRAEWRVRQTPY